MTRYSVTMPLANARHRSDDDLYDEVDRRFGVAEELGYDTVFTNEHHFSDYTVCPDTMVLLAYVAGRTERIRLGTSVIVLPWHSPIRIAEQIAMLDQLSCGRVLPGLGRGTAIHEHEKLGVDPEESRERFAETLEVIRLAFAGCEFDYDGKFHSYRGVELRPRPRRRDIPMIGASTSPPSCEILGRLGLGIMMMGNGQLPSESLAGYDAWLAALQGAGHDRGGFEAVYHGLAYVADTDEEAYDAVAEVLPTALATQVAHYEILRNRWLETEAYRTQGEMAKQFAGAIDTLDERTMARLECDQQLVGSPATIARRIRAFVDGGFDHISFYVDWGGAVDLDTIVGQMERIMRDVVPLVEEVEPETVEGPTFLSVGF